MKKTLELRRLHFIYDACTFRIEAKPGINLFITLIAMGIEIVPPFSTIVQPSATPQAAQKCFRVVQYQYPRL